MTRRPLRSIFWGMRLLVVEDEDDLRAGLANALRREGYAVDEAADGEVGLYKALNTDYDVAVLDVMLPKLDGWHVLDGLRNHKRYPVLMLTARDQAADRVRGLDGGADDYLVKPFDNAELFARLRALIRRNVRHPSVEIALGDVRIDTASKTVRRAGAPVLLTAREYALLEYLALRRGQVVPRAALYEHLLDENREVLSNVLDVHVAKLRKKIGKHLLETRRGQGYCIP
jgi:two-component system, OmpR family, response regulator